jgi:uncharacterized protein YjbJ (UPF0337 family)
MLAPRVERFSAVPLHAHLRKRKKRPMAMKDKMKNLFQISKGKTKRAAGNASGDQDLAAEGRADEATGNLKQAGEKVKDAFREH